MEPIYYTTIIFQAYGDKKFKLILNLPYKELSLKN